MITKKLDSSCSVEQDWLVVLSFINKNSYMELLI